MGAWGHDSFENDEASDWVYELEDSADMSAIHEALNGVTDNAGEYIEAPEGSMAIAAAEVVAALHGNPSQTLPDNVRAWINGKPKPDRTITTQTLGAIDVVLSSDSELKELWEENVDDYPKWVAAVSDIKARIPNLV